MLRYLAAAAYLLEGNLQAELQAGALWAARVRPVY